MGLAFFRAHFKNQLIGEETGNCCRLWISAIIGLACGAGFYELALFSTVIVFLAEVLFSKIEYRLMHDNKSLQLSVEYEHTSALNAILKYLNEQGLKILDLDIYKYTYDDTSMLMQILHCSFLEKFLQGN